MKQKLLWIFLKVYTAGSVKMYPSIIIDELWDTVLRIIKIAPKSIRYAAVLTTIPLLSSSTLAAQTNHLFFKDLYKTPYSNDQQVKEALKANNTNENLLVDAANYYYVKGATTPGKAGLEFFKLSFELYQKALKSNYSDPRLLILMANAYAYHGNNPEINIEILLQYIFRARNLYTMVADQYPENLEARLGRIRINMNLTPATGRPDPIHRDDITTYLAGYQNLPEKEKESRYFKMGLMEVYLARALLFFEEGNLDKVNENLRNIEPGLLHHQALERFKQLKKEIEKRGNK